MLYRIAGYISVFIGTLLLVSSDTSTGIQQILLCVGVVMVALPYVVCEMYVVALKQVLLK